MKHRRYRLGCAFLIGHVVVCLVVAYELAKRPIGLAPVSEGAVTQVAEGTDESAAAEGDSEGAAGLQQPPDDVPLALVWTDPAGDIDLMAMTALYFVALLAVSGVGAVAITSLIKWLRGR